MPATIRLGFIGAAMGDPPARTLGHVAAHQQDRDGEHGAQQEAGAPWQPVEPGRDVAAHHRSTMRKARGASGRAAVPVEQSLRSQARPRRSVRNSPSRTQTPGVSQRSSSLPLST